MPTATRRVTTVVDGTPQGGGKVIFVFNINLLFIFLFIYFFILSHFMNVNVILDVKDFEVTSKCLKGSRIKFTLHF